MPTKKPKIILIVDKHESFDLLYHSLLDNMYEVLIAHSKEMGLKIIEKHTPNTIILDLDSDKMQQIIEYCLQKHPGISILVLSNKSDIDHLKEYDNVKGVKQKENFNPQSIIESIA